MLAPRTLDLLVAAALRLPDFLATAFGAFFLTEAALLRWRSNSLSDKPNKASTTYEKQKARKRFRRRAGIEPVISHVKHHHRMLKNYLKGVAGDEINAIMSASGFNFKSLLRKIKAECFFFICKIKNYIKIIFGFRVLQA